jgi:hypothetical protein
MTSEKQGETERKAWIEPEVRTLEVRDTAIFLGRGPDGGVRNPDCTRS